MNYFKDLPTQEQLMAATKEMLPEPLSVNAHIHSPYSFSSFTGLDQAFALAVSENIGVLGINDFYVTDGYDEFAKLARQNRIFPLFNIEAIALSKTLQEQGIRVNDPGNPGRTYICGKGLNYPSAMGGKCGEMLENVKTESQRQMVEMIEKLNAWLKETGIDMVFTYEEIRQRFARQLVRERHIAQAVRSAVFERYADDAQRRAVLQKIYGGRPSSADLHQAASLENELRNNLLKAGAKAFVPEDEKAFLTIEQICAIILEAGGIPCYPVLLDGAPGRITEFETDRDVLFQHLREWNIRCIELIPQRNKLEVMEPFVRYFHEKGFTVTFGTEHNAPGLIPLTPCCSGNTPLTGFLRQVSYEGACVIAAHQYLRAQGGCGFMDEPGKPLTDRRDSLAQLGNAVIKNWTGDIK
jgi:predicted metal-dependent phosphoesterase TrpH